MNFRDHISGREGSEPINMIVTAYPVKNGKLADKGFMIHAELDQSGFRNLADENGKVDEKKIENVEAHPRITTRPSFMSNEKMLQMVQAGHFVKFEGGTDEKGNQKGDGLVGSIRTTVTHGLGKGSWVPDPDYKEKGVGWRETAACKTAEEFFNQRDKSRANAAIKLDYEKSKLAEKAPEKAEEATKSATDAVIEAATGAKPAEKAAEKPAVELSADDIMAKAGADAPAKSEEKAAEKAVEDDSLPF